MKAGLLFIIKCIAEAKKVDNFVSQATKGNDKKVSSPTNEFRTGPGRLSTYLECVGRLLPLASDHSDAIN